MRRALETDLDFAYAESASPAARERIRRDLERISSAVADADPHLRALVLTGGFSRGEGTLHDGAPVNDYDLVAVRSRPGGDARYRTLGAALHRELGIEVDLLPIWRRRLPLVGRKLFWLDARLGARVIAGDRSALERLPRFGPEEVPRAEIARLLGNRAAGLLLALPGAGEPIDARQRDLQATKAVLAALDATLLHESRYAARLRERLAMTSGHPDHALFEAAVEWKLTGGCPLPADWWDEASACLLRAVDETRARTIRDGAAEHAIHLARARRLRWRGPSRAVREAAWDLLATSRFPDGPKDGLRVLSRFGPTPRAEWRDLKPRFFEIRARTLQ